MTKSSTDYVSALLDMLDGVLDRDGDSYRRCARALEELVGAGAMPSSMTFYVSLYAALCYDIANMPTDAARMYRTLSNRYGGEFDDMLPSVTYAGDLVAGIAGLGRRDTKPLSHTLSKIASLVRDRESASDQPPMREHQSDYEVLMALLVLIDKFFSSMSDSSNQARSLALVANEMRSEISQFDISPMLRIMAILCLDLVRASEERSVANLNLPDAVKKCLGGAGYRELWPVQLQAIGSGLLDGRSMVCAAPAGSGKTCLAYMAAGRQDSAGGAVYLVPTGTLSRQAYDDFSRALGSARIPVMPSSVASDCDEVLGESDIVVTTYEKMDYLLRSCKVRADRIRTLIIDEAHTIGEGPRGLALEMLLTRLMAAKNGSPLQVVALSTSTSCIDTGGMAGWLDADPVTSKWRPVDIDECICHDDRIHYRDGRETQQLLPLSFAPPACIGKGDLESRVGACFQFYRQAAVEGRPLLVLAGGRQEATRLAGKIAEVATKAMRLDPDLLLAVQESRASCAEMSRKIREAEADLPSYAEDLATLLEMGIAYYSAGLPAKYRKVVEDAARAGKIRTMIATDVPGGGTCMPFATVLFLNPLAPSNGTCRLDRERYRDIAGRAVGAGHGRACRAVLLAMSDDELERCRQVFWESDMAPVRSPLGASLRGGRASYDDAAAEGDMLLSHLLWTTAERGAATAEDLVNSMNTSWFWRDSATGPDLRSTLVRSIPERMSVLEEWGLVVREGGSDSLYAPTKRGRVASTSMLLPSSSAVIGRCIESVDWDSLRDSDICDAVLVLAGTSSELARRHGPLVTDATVPPRLERLRPVFQRALRGDGARLSDALRLAAMLSLWVDSTLVEDIAEKCGRDCAAHAADIESLSLDSAWIVSSIAGIVHGLYPRHGRLAGALAEVAESCRRGTSDATVLGLLNMGLGHMGRETAIRMARYLCEKNRKYESISVGDAMSLFPNKIGAEALAGEIRRCKAVHQPPPEAAAPAPRVPLRRPAASSA